MPERTKFVVNYTTEDLITGKRCGHWTTVNAPAKIEKLPIHTARKWLEKAISNKYDPYLVGVDVIYFVSVNQDKEEINVG